MAGPVPGANGTRTEAYAPLTTCPYCALRSGSHLYLSDGQRNYVERYVETLLRALEEGRTVTIDFSQVNSQFSGNPKLQSELSEERQQTKFRCTGCQQRSDIEAVTATARDAAAATRSLRFWQNSKSYELESRRRVIRRPNVANENRSGEKSFEAPFPRSTGSDETSWRSCSRCPRCPRGERRWRMSTSTGRSRRQSNSGPISDFDLLRGLDSEVQRFLKRRFLRRHIYEHNSALADAEYIAESGEQIALGNSFASGRARLRLS